MWTNHFRTHTYTVSFIGLFYSRPLSTCPNHPRTRYQKTKDNSSASEPTSIIQLASPKPAHLSCPFLPEESTIKSLAHVFTTLYVFWLTLSRPYPGPCTSLSGLSRGIPCPLFLGIYEYKNFFLDIYFYVFVSQLHLSKTNPCILKTDL